MLWRSKGRGKRIFNVQDAFTLVDMKGRRINIIMITLSLVLPGLLHSWGWEKIYSLSSWDQAYEIKQTPDGGYIVVGQTYDASYYMYAILIKLGVNGNEEWKKMYGGPDINPFGMGVDLTSDGGYIVTGMKMPSTDVDVYLIKTDSSGNTNWTKGFGGSSGDVGYSVKQSSDGGFIIAGYTSSYGAGGWDVYLIKTTSSGNMSWYKTYGGADEDRAFSVQQTLDGGYIIAGFTKSYGAGNYDVYLIKTDSSGNMSWYKTYGRAAADYGYSVDQTSDGGYIISGTINDRVTLIKTDSSGNTNWTKLLNTTYPSSCGQSVQQTLENDYITAGYVIDASFNCYIHIAKYDPLNPGVPDYVFDIKTRNIKDRQEADQFSWTNITFQSQGWIVSDQYYEINYLNFHSVNTGWGLQIHTHNKD
ncbi:MAG: hypothetical protein PHF84_07545, partial [bacterium]|nr:hypothetical protein [bacterium]